ncbi:MAG: hypothetical protein IAG13_33490, partial [Deltaproteobacteria bacterium]|nr:hypothetical protein [Nannocystaceae bacterium]
MPRPSPLQLWSWLALVTPAACDPTDDEASSPAAELAPETAASSDAIASDDTGTAPEPVIDPALSTAAAAPGRAAPVRLGVVDHRGASDALARVLMIRAGVHEAPSEIRRADRATMLYAAPRFAAEFRGKLPHGERFGVFEHLAGDPECGAPGWARVGRSAFVCLEHTSITKQTPVELPRLAKRQLTPYYYARVSRKSAKGLAPLPGRWASRASLAAGDAPAELLTVDHDYAFEQRRASRHGTLLVDNHARVVREADVRRMEPSTFAGRDVVARPL